MAITLAEAKNNVQTDYDPFVIDEFRKINPMMDLLPFDDAVNPSGGGGTLTYGYRRLATQATAATREINTEYSKQNVTTTKHNVDLAVMGGAFEVDRVIARNLGAGDSSAVDLNLRQKIKATGAKFNDLVINGDTAVDANGFDGLDKALSGTTTELVTLNDWSNLDAANVAHTALDLLDEALGLIDGAATFVVGNKKTLAKIRGIVRRSGQYVREPIDGLSDRNGRPVERESYGGVWFIDAGDKPGTANPVIPIRAQQNVTITVTAVSGDISFKVGTETITVAYDASAATLATALEEVVPGVTVTKASSVFTVKSPLASTDAFSTVTSGGVTIAAAEGSDAGATGLTDLYIVRAELDGFHGVTTVGSQMVETFLPDFTTPGAVKVGEVELGPVAVALKATKAAAVIRNIKVQ